MHISISVFMYVLLRLYVYILSLCMYCVFEEFCIPLIEVYRTLLTFEFRKINFFQYTL